MDETERTERTRKGMRPPVKWHGGKFYLCHRIISLFPPHHTYVEPFGGAASVLLNKPPSEVEVYNDLDQRITRLFRVIRDSGTELQRRLALTPYSEIEFHNAEEPATDEELKKLVGTLCGGVCHLAGGVILSVLPCTGFGDKWLMWYRATSRQSMNSFLLS